MFTARWAFPVVQGLKNPTANEGDSFDPRAKKIPWRRKWLPIPVFLPKNPMDRGAWRAPVYGVAKELDITYN